MISLVSVIFRTLFSILLINSLLDLSVSNTKLLIFKIIYALAVLSNEFRILLKCICLLNSENIFTRSSFEYISLK